MLPEIFTIEKGKVLISPNCLLIPELKAIHDKYEDPIPAFSYLHFKFDPLSPYANMEEDIKEDTLLIDFAGDYTLEDQEMLDAIKKLESLYVTPTYRYYLDSKILLEKLGTFARMTPITTGRDGNLSALAMQVKSVGKTIQEFKQLEKIVLQELSEGKGRTRGNKKIAYDQ
jgi:hypothetical protein